MFITLEGIEGSGKTTQLAPITAYLESRGVECLVTREPGGTPIGGQLRAILLNPEIGTLDPLAELLLYLADRAQHLAETIGPSLRAGKAVLCDRYVDATLAYQGHGRQQNPERIELLHALLFADLKPDITLLLDVSPEIGLSRAWKRIGRENKGDAETRFEKEALHFHHRVRAGYLSLARAEPKRFRIIDAARDEADVTRQIIRALAAAMESER